ncbi:MAG: tetraacyldisaccharide 4'-kinase, partial [Phycisphaerae bacterium]|nr:tetraacyldisaccharide 4'-kinase [Phycisphaerae bacterium]
NTVKDLGVNLLGSQVFDDHHHYTNGCLAEICGQAQRLGADLALTTQKDWTKIASLLSGERNLSFAFLVVEIRFQAEEEELRALIENTLAVKIFPGEIQK